VAAGTWIMRSHYISYWFFVCFVFFNTCNGHSGYHLPLLNSPEFHDYHHLK
jgi:methylsterol monooxygenase